MPQERREPVGITAIAPKDWINVLQPHAAGRGLRVGRSGLFSLKAYLSDYEERKQRATRRAAASLSTTRLIKRGLLECPRPGIWRLTPAGLKLARWIWPEVKPPTKRELAHGIALRKAISALEDAHPTWAGKRRRRPKQGTRPPGIELDL